MNDLQEKIIDGNLFVYCENDGNWYPKTIVNNGTEMVLDTDYFLYVLPGHSMQESIELETEEQEIEDYNLTPWYGEARAEYLRDNHTEWYFKMKNDNSLKKYLVDVDKRALALEEKLIERAAKAEGIDEELKRTAQMKWVGLMNNLKMRVREVVQEALIFV